jgi:hypothetical protein
LQRARETISAAAPDQNSTSTGAKEAALLNRYIQAFERFDLDN